MLKYEGNCKEGEMGSFFRCDVPLAEFRNLTNRVDRFLHTKSTERLCDDSIMRVIVLMEIRVVY